jgi:hypothetical protein
MKKVILATVLAALVAMPAYASVQNVKVSGDIESTYVVRNQFDLGHQTATNQYRQNFLLTQTRLRVDADLTDNVQTTVGLLNERVWGEEDTNNGVDLNLAYVTLKEMLYSPLTVIIGRHNFAFGNSFIIDSTGTNNAVTNGGLNGAAEDLSKRTSMDSVHAILDYNPLTINIIGASVDQNNVLGTGAKKDNINLYGTNAAYQLGDKWQTMVEGYFWAKLDESSLNAGGAGAKTDTVYLPGIHASTNPIKGLNLSAEVAMQRGTKYQGSSNNVKREATAAQLIANYALPIAKIEKYSPMIMGAYTYVSGDKRTWEGGNTATSSDNETRYTAWDPMFENQAGGTIYNSIFNLSNAHIITAKASAKPIEDVTASVQLDNLWLDKEVEGGVLPIVRPDGSTLNTTGTTNMFLGSELGLGLAYAYTDDVTLGAKLNWFTPGAAFSSDNQNVASQVLVNANVNF